MTYFNYFPTIQYTFQNNKTFEMVDVFRKAVFSQNTLNNESVFETQQLTIAPSPEVASFNLYQNSAYSWILFASNNLVNPHTDWPTEWTAFLNSLDKKYNGTTYYIFYQPSIQVGDVIIQLGITGSCSGASTEDYSGCSFVVDDSTYGIVKEWNSEFRYVTTVGESGLTFNEDTLFGVARKDSTNTLRMVDFGDNYPRGKISNTTFSVFKIQRAESEKNSISYFLSNGSVVSPYAKISPVEVGGLVTNYFSKANATKITPNVGYLTDPDNFYGTALYCYSTDGIKAVPTSLQIKTKYQEEVEQNEKKYVIKALKPGFLTPTFGLFQRAINSSGRLFEIQLSY